MTAITEKTRWDTNYYFVSAPTRPQAKKNYWEDLKLLSKPFWRRPPYETELIVFLEFEGVVSDIHVLSMDVPQRLEGSPWNGGTLDEFGNMKRKVWYEHVRPALSDRMGWCDFIGVPEGRNHYFNIALLSCGGVIPEPVPKTGVMARGDDPEWGYYHWLSEDILDIIAPGEMEAARRDLDERTFDQEYRGSFLTYEGQLYYTFDRQIHRNDEMAKWEPEKPLYLTCDFNKSPMVWEVGQLFDRKIGERLRKCLKFIDEISIAYDAKTQANIFNFLARYKDHRNKIIYVTGDASGNIENTRDRTTDYIFIRDSLVKNGWRVTMKVPSGNPNINNRVNIACSLLKSVTGDIRMFVNSRCKFLINDWELNESDGKGGKDKEDPQQTHGSDGADYLIWLLFKGEFYGTQIMQI